MSHKHGAVCECCSEHEAALPFNTGHDWIAAKIARKKNLVIKKKIKDQFHIPEICLEENSFAVGKTHHDAAAE